MNKIRLGVSACLMGEKVRYDGQHKLDRYLTDTLSKWIEFVPVCPEFELGLGVPRETMRLEGDPEHPRLMTGKTRRDLTDSMLAWCDKRVRQLEEEQLCGFVFKSKSPSSGMERVKVYQENGMPLHTGRGLFANAFMNHFPLLPVEEEGRLHDIGLRENFFDRVFTLIRWREMLAEEGTKRGLVRFHERHKLFLMSHGITIYRELGRIVADLKSRSLSEIQAEYFERLMAALRLKTTVKKQVNVLQHMAGYFKKMLVPEEKQELQQLITQYHDGIVPLIVPLTLINHYVRKYQVEYLADQIYLQPHPIELQLRNHA